MHSSIESTHTEQQTATGFSHLQQRSLELAILVKHLLPLGRTTADGLEDVGQLQLCDALPDNPRERGRLVAPQHEWLLGNCGWAVSAPLADSAVL